MERMPDACECLKWKCSVVKGMVLRQSLFPIKFGKQKNKGSPQGKKLLRKGKAMSSSYRIIII